MFKFSYCAIVPLCLCTCLLASCAKRSEPANSSKQKVQEVDQEVSLVQYSELKEGDPIVTIKTNYGDMVFRLFPEYAPKACENFTSLAEDGYYKGILFHRVINNFMIQGGDPLGDGTGGQSKWGKEFEDEFSPNLRNFYGALSMANAGPNTNGSQFFIVQAHEELPIQQLAALGLPDLVAEKYAQVGGTPWLDGKHTVFGQIIEGFEVLNKIAQVEVDPSNDKPTEDVVINEVVTGTYSEDKAGAEKTKA